MDDVSNKNSSRQISILSIPHQFRRSTSVKKNDVKHSGRVEVGGNNQEPVVIPKDYFNFGGKFSTKGLGKLPKFYLG